MIKIIYEIMIAMYEKSKNFAGCKFYFFFFFVWVVDFDLKFVDAH